MRLRLLVCGLVLAAALPAHAQWKWKDARGQVHVSDTPPPHDVPDKDIVQRPTQRRAPVASTAASTPASAAPTRPPTDPELEARKARAEAEQKAKAKADDDKVAAMRAENCQRARQHMATLQSGQRLARMNAQGEREVLDDKARAEEMASARRVIDADCR
jgi:hypothetical protein